MISDHNRSHVKTLKFRRIHVSLCGVICFFALMLPCLCAKSARSETLSPWQALKVQEENQTYPNFDLNLDLPMPAEDEDEVPEGEENDLLENAPQAPQNNGSIFDGLRRFFGGEAERDSDEGPRDAPSGCQMNPQELEKLYEEYEML